MGKAVPRPLVAPGAPGIVVAGPLVVEPGEEPAPDFVLDVGLGDAGVFATVTVGALPVALTGEPLPLATETVAELLIVSPAGAVLGTLTCASICDAAGCFASRVRSQLVQLPTVNTGWLNAGVFAPGVSVVAIVPSSGELDHAEIRNRMMPWLHALRRRRDGHGGPGGRGARARGRRRRAGRRG